MVQYLNNTKKGKAVYSDYEKHVKKVGNAFDFATIKAKLFNIATNVGFTLLATASVKLIDTLHTTAEEYVETQEKIIQKSNENIENYDSEISSLESLQSQLKDAKDNKIDLIKVTNELNKAIGETPGLINGEAESYELANKKLEARIEYYKKLREQELDNIINANKNIFENNGISNEGIGSVWDFFNSGVDRVFDGSFNSYLYTDYIEGVKKVENLVNKDFGEIINSYLDINPNLSKNEASYKILKDFLGFEDLSFIPSQSEFDNLLSKQLSTLKSYYSDYISSYDGSIDNSLIYSFMEDMILNGYNLEEISDKLKHILNDSVFEDLYKNYQLSFTDDSLNTEEIYNSLKIYFDDLKKEFPTIANEIDILFDSLITGIKDVSDASPPTVIFDDIFALKDAETATTKLGELSDQIDKIKTAYKNLKDAMDSYSSTGTITIDQFQSIVEQGSKFLDYLTLEDGQLSLNEQAMYDLAEARIIEMKAQMVQGIIDNVEKINTEADADLYLASTNYELAESYHALAEAQLRTWYYSSTLSKDTKDEVIAKARNDIAKINELVTSINLGSIGGSSTKDAEKSAKEYVDSYMEFMKSSLETNRIDFRTYSNDVSAFLKKMFDEGKISGKEYFDYTKEMLEVQQNIYDKALSAIIRRFDKEIEKINKSIDAIKKHNDVLNEQKDNYDKILSVIDSVYENEVKKIEEQKQVLQDKIDSLNDEADAYDLIRRKEQALYALEQSQNQRVKKIYSGSERGIIYTTDQEKIREVQDNLKDIENEEIISMLEKEQEALDKSIESLEKYRNMWQEISDVYEIEQNKQLAIALFGKGYEDFILSNRLSNIEDFKNNYISIQKQIDNNESMIKSYEEKIQYYEDLKSQWNSITNAYEQSIEDQYAVMLLGQNWEKDVLSGRIDTLNNFANNYFNIQKAIADAAWNSANEQIKAAEAAQKAQPSVDTVETKEPKHYNTRYKVVVAGAPIKDFGNSYTAKMWMKNNAPSGTIVPYQVPVYAKGGVIGTKKSPLDSIAQSLGEDHLVAGKEGERFLTPVQNEMWEKWTEALPNLQNFANMLQYNIPNYNFDNMIIRNNNKPTPTINIGDIHLHEVQNVPDFAKALQKHLPNISVQYNGKH